MLIALGVLIALAAALNVYLLVAHKDGAGDGLKDFIPLIALALLLFSLWTRISRLEAEHGADYTPPALSRQRVVVLILALVALALGVVAAVVFARHP